MHDNKPDPKLLADQAQYGEKFSADTHSDFKHHHKGSEGDRKNTEPQEKTAEENQELNQQVMPGKQKTFSGQRPGVKTKPGPKPSIMPNSLATPEYGANGSFSERLKGRKGLAAGNKTRDGLENFTIQQSQAHQKITTDPAVDPAINQQDLEAKPRNSVKKRYSRTSKRSLVGKNTNTVSKPSKNKSLRYTSTIKEISAGGLIVRGLGTKPLEELEVAIIGRFDRRGRIAWSIPKGHIEIGETAEVAARREIQEETGLVGRVIAQLGTIDYSFIIENKRIQKTVHHFLLAYVEGTLKADDVEVHEVAWFPFIKLPEKLTYADERKLCQLAYTTVTNTDTSIDNLHKLGKVHNRTEPDEYEITAADYNSKREELLCLAEQPLARAPESQPKSAHSRKKRAKKARSKARRNPRSSGPTT